MFLIFRFIGNGVHDPFLMRLRLIQTGRSGVVPTASPYLNAYINPYHRANFI